MMPGMVNCHFHATYHELGRVPALFGTEEPMALQAVRTVNNLELLVSSEFTSAVSAGAPFAVDASMKIAIDRGLIRGPRLVPYSRDISTTGHAGAGATHRIGTWGCRCHPAERRARRVPPGRAPRSKRARR
ncbi:MAG: hypothetical protein ACRDYE_04890 [Acidimicrobiales bacterium]